MYRFPPSINSYSRPYRTGMHFNDDPTDMITANETANKFFSDPIKKKPFREMAHPVIITTDGEDGVYFDIDDVLDYYRTRGDGYGHFPHPQKPAHKIWINEDIEAVTWRGQIEDNRAYVNKAIQEEMAKIPPYDYTRFPLVYEPNKTIDDIVRPYSHSKTLVKLFLEYAKSHYPIDTEFSESRMLDEFITFVFTRFENKDIGQQMISGLKSTFLQKCKVFANFRYSGINLIYILPTYPAKAEYEEATFIVNPSFESRERAFIKNTQGTTHLLAEIKRERELGIKLPQAQLSPLTHLGQLKQTVIDNMIATWIAEDVHPEHRDRFGE